MDFINIQLTLESVLEDSNLFSIWSIHFYYENVLFKKAK